MDPARLQRADWIRCNSHNRAVSSIPTSIAIPVIALMPQSRVAFPKRNSRKGWQINGSLHALREAGFSKLFKEGPMSEQSTRVKYATHPTWSGF
jgi:hypothetical protein